MPEAAGMAFIKPGCYSVGIEQKKTTLLSKEREGRLFRLWLMSSALMNRISTAAAASANDEEKNRDGDDDDD